MPIKKTKSLIKTSGKKEKGDDTSGCMTFTNQQFKNVVQICGFVGSIIALSMLAGKSREQFKAIFFKWHSLIGISSFALAISLNFGSEIWTSVFMGFNQIA